jgi:hypothetical protein
MEHHELKKEVSRKFVSEEVFDEKLGSIDTSKISSQHKGGTTTSPRTGPVGEHSTTPQGSNDVTIKRNREDKPKQLDDSDSPAKAQRRPQLKFNPFAKLVSRLENEFIL